MNVKNARIRSKKLPLVIGLTTKRRLTVLNVEILNSAKMIKKELKDSKFHIIWPIFKTKITSKILKYINLEKIFSLRLEKRVVELMILAVI